MKLKLHENPNEWRKFTLSASAAASLFTGLLCWRHPSLKPGWFAFMGLMALVIMASLFFPSWFRGFYRAGMTISHHIGRVVGTMLLTVFFFLVVTPMGLMLRILGKDLLQIKRPKSAATYWQPAKTTSHFDRQF